MATFVTDTFTDTDTTVLSSHTGETGATWTLNPNTAASIVVTDANRVRSTTASRSDYLSSGVPASAEYDVQATIRQFSSNANQYLGITGRAVSASDDCYMAIYSKPNGGWILAKRVGGVFTQLGATYSVSLSDGVDYTVKLEIRDATKKLYVDGVERISSADNVLTAAGKAGVFSLGFATSNSTGMHLDTFSAADPGVGGGSTDLTLMWLPVLRPHQRPTWKVVPSGFTPPDRND